jgi:hypothetical protein
MKSNSISFFWTRLIRTKLIRTKLIRTKLIWTKLIRTKPIQTKLIRTKLIRTKLIRTNRQSPPDERSVARTFPALRTTSEAEPQHLRTEKDQFKEGVDLMKPLQLGRASF